MEVYILDSLYRPTAVVDTHESFIWTERFKAIGDFEFVLHSTLENRNLFPVGTLIAIEESYRVMKVETVLDSTDSEGNASLKLTGRSLEEILENRLAKADFTDLTTAPKWIIEDLPADIVRKIFHDICVTGVLDPGDIIPSVSEVSIFPPDTIPEPSDEVVYAIDPTTVYLAMKTLCDIYNIGFRLVRDPSTFQLHFDVYMGSDRTTSQTDLDAVVFSPGLGNLKNTSELTTIALYKNVAYILTPLGYEIVYADGVDETVAGFERQVLVVVANDITDPETVTPDSIQRGKEELAKARRFSVFDGEISQNSQYKYGIHYHLGDHVEKESPSGSSSIMQVTEQIFVSDQEGDRSYPTLTIVEFITPGSWDSLNPDLSWDDIDPDLVWNDFE